jgi:parvulin-like peptidyl-prolyl isomerase
MYAEELRRIVERELILDELFAKVKSKSKGQAGVLDELAEAAAKEADRRMRDFKAKTQVATDAEFRALLQTQGLTVTGLRRQVERGFMMQAYLRDLLAPRLNGISLGDIRDYYDEHADEFKAEDSVKWLDLFLNASKFRSRAEARQYAETLLAHARAGADFMKLVKEYDHGLAGGTGEGTKRGEIRPAEAEAVVFGLKQGEAALVEMETGFHIVKVAERTYAGRRPFDEKTQTEIRKILQGIVSEREYQRIVETLWRRHQPQILVSEPQ